MHPSSALEGGWGGIFSHDIAYQNGQMPKQKRTFVNLKKTWRITEIMFWPIRTQLSEPLSADKNQWFQNHYLPLLNGIKGIGLQRLSLISEESGWRN